MGVFHRLIIVLITLSQHSKSWILVSVNCISKLLIFFSSFPRCDWYVSPLCNYHGCTHHPFSIELLQSILSTLTRVTILKCKLDPVPSILKYFKVFLVHLRFSTRLPWWLNGKESACSTGDTGSIPGLGRSPGGGHGNPLQYSCLENPMDKGAWPVIVHSIAKSRT